MADKRIDQLTRSTAANDSDLLVIQDGAITKYIQVVDLFARALVSGNNLNDVSDPAVALGNLNGLTSAQINTLVNNLISNLFDKYKSAILIGGFLSNFSKSNVGNEDMIVSGCEYINSTTVSEGYVVIKSGDSVPTLYYQPQVTVDASKTYFFEPDDDFNQSIANQSEIQLRCELVETNVITSSTLTPSVDHQNYNSTALVVKSMIQPELVSLPVTIGTGFQLSTALRYQLRVLKKKDGEAIITGAVRVTELVDAVNTKTVFSWDTSVLPIASGYQLLTFPVRVIRGNETSPKPDFSMSITGNTLTVIGDPLDRSGGGGLEPNDILIMEGIRFNTNV